MKRPACALGCAAAAVMLSAAACGTTRAGNPAAAGTGTQGTRTQGTRTQGTRTRGTAAQHTPAVARSSATGTCPGPRAWAEQVTASGQVAWQDSLPVGPGNLGIRIAPLVAGGDAVFAEANAVYAIRLRDGRQLWHRAFSAKAADLAGAVYGTWEWQGTVAVLSGQVSSDARLTGLDAGSGAVRWTLRLPKSGLLGSQAQGADGTLAVQLQGGTIESVDLATGRVLWSRRADPGAGPAAAGPVIAAGGGNGTAAGYDSRTGQLLWSVPGLPQQTDLTAADGLLLALSHVHGAGQSTAVTALNPRTGKAAWTFDPGEPVTVLGAGPAGIAFATYVPNRRLYLVSQATGHMRWSAATFALAESEVPGQFAETGGYVVIPEDTAATPPAHPRIVARSAATGRVIWSVPLGTGGAAGLNLALVPLPGGEAVAVTTTAGSGTALSARLTLDWLATGRPFASTALPDPVPVPLAVTGTTILAQPGSFTCSPGPLTSSGAS